MKRLLVVVAGVFAVIGAWHYYWAFGGRLGSGAVIPQSPTGDRLFKPTRQATFVVATIFVAVAVLSVAHVGYVPTSMSPRKRRALFVAIAFILTLRAVGDFRYVGTFKRVRNTQFARYDTWFYSPTSFMLAVCLYIAGIYG